MIDFTEVADHIGLKATRPKPVEALGLKGVSIDVRVKSSQPRKYKDCGKVEGDCVVMFVGKVEPIVYGSSRSGASSCSSSPTASSSSSSSTSSRRPR